MQPKLIRCPSCGYTLKPADLHNQMCPYCKAALAQPAPSPNLGDMFADRDGDGVPDVVQELLEAQPNAANGKSVKVVSVQSSTVVQTSVTTNGAPGELPPEVNDLLRKIGVAAPTVPTTRQITVGARVLVAWSDGKTYPGEVTQLGKDKLLIRFQDGRQVWVDRSFLTLAKR